MNNPSVSGFLNFKELENIKWIRKIYFISILIGLSTQLVFSQSKVVYNSTTSTINGEPFFVKGIYTSANPNLQKIKEAGLNVVMSYGSKNMGQSAAKQFLDEAENNGLYILFHINKDDVLNYEIDKVLELVNNLKNHPALYGWYLSDEPSLQGIYPLDLKDFYDEIKTSDPNHPVFTSNWKITQFAETTDVDMRQLYQGIPWKMQDVLSDEGQGYISEIEDLNLSWLAILNTHASKFGNTNVNPINYTSPAQWYKDVNQGTSEYNIRQNRADDLNKSDVINNPFGKTDRYGMEFIKSDNFPDSENRIRGQIACALAYKSNALFWWLWDEGGAINKRWGWYTIYHYTPTKNSHKKILKEVEKVEKILSAEKEIDKQYSTIGIFYRYIKDEKGRELVIAFNETEIDKSLILTLPANVGTKYVNLTTELDIDLSTTELQIEGNGGVILVNDPDLVLSTNSKNLNKIELFQNSPNPFHSSTNISYNLQNSDMVDLTIFNLLGMPVRTLVKSFHNSGAYNISWNGNDNNGKRLPVGMYLCVLKTGENSKNNKIFLQ